MKTLVSKYLFLAILALFWNSKAVRCVETPFTSKENDSEIAENANAAEGDNFLQVRQIYTDLEKRLKSIVSSTIKTSMKTVMREVYRRNLSSLCLSSLLQLTGALRQTKLWAFQMIDASGKIPVGFFAGTLTSLGNYEECVGIKVDQPRVKIQGQYCLLEVIPPRPKWRPRMSVHLPVPELRNVSAPDTVIRFISSFAHNFYLVSVKAGLCTPAACSKDDIDKLLQIIPEKLEMDWVFKVNTCETKTSFHLSHIQVFLVYLFVLIAILTIVATLADFILEQEFTERKGAKGTIFRLLRCFSLRLNMQIIANYTAPEEKLSFVYGFMWISIIWIIGANIFMHVNYDISANFMEALEMTLNTFYQMLNSRLYPEQTLLFLLAFVNTYKWMKSPEQKLSIWKYIFKSYWRYTPTYMLVIALFMLTPAWGSGPSWMKYMAPFYSNCESNWWTNVLYINNYVHADKICQSSTWFFAVAAQLHIIGLLVLILLKTRPKTGLLMTLLLMIAGLFGVFFANMYYGTPPNEVISFLNEEDRLLYAMNTYHHSYYHLPAYCCGIFAGYLVATKPMMRIPKKLSYFLWIFIGAVTCTTLCLVTIWSKGDMPRPILSASYDAFSKMVWATFLLWATVSCAIERKGLCYDVTSWGAFPFLSRLTFIVMIINPSIVTMIFGIKKAHIFVSDFEIFYNFGTLIVANAIVAYAIHVSIESPLLQLTKVLKRTCGMKTFSPAVSTTNSSAYLCDEVITEKPPRKKKGDSD